jgi:hypothetical protein
MALIGWWSYVRFTRCALCCSFDWFDSLSAIRLHFGRHVGNALLVITILQFHFPFYLSRPLPNTFALYISTIFAVAHSVVCCLEVDLILYLLVLHAFTLWLYGQYERCMFLFTVVIIVFRSEVLVHPRSLVELRI